MIKLDDLTFGQIKEIKNLLGNKTKNHPYKINQNYFIRTVTYFFTGKLIEVFDNELVLDNVCWIPETGRYADSFITGKHNEVEPVPGQVIIGRNAIIDCTEWSKELPSKQV